MPTATHPTIPADARAVLTINLAALRSNWATINRTSGAAECAGVIKADAYGLGLEEIATALRNEGCKTFFVATLAEARRVRAIDPSAAIYVLDGLLMGAAAHYAGFDLRPCLSSLEEVREWAAQLSRARRPITAPEERSKGQQISQGKAEDKLRNDPQGL